MSPAPSFTPDVETATAFRDWLFETGVENHAEPQTADPLAELAATIDGELLNSTEYVAISASTTAAPPTDYPTGVGDADSLTQQKVEDSTRLADGIPIDVAAETPADSTTDSPTTRGTAHSTVEHCPRQHADSVRSIDITNSNAQHRGRTERDPGSISHHV